MPAYRIVESESLGEFPRLVEAIKAYQAVHGKMNTPWFFEMQGADGRWYRGLYKESNLPLYGGAE